MGFFDGGFKGVVSGVGSILSGGLGLLGNSMENSYNEAAAARDREFQREVYQNQYQWKAADAKKAGLHPLAVLGSGTYSASPSSVPSADFSKSLGKLGEGIGDTFAGFMTKDEAAALAAKKDKQADEQHDMNMRETASRIYANNANALEATRRAASYTTPMASGMEIVPGQTDSDDMRKAGKFMGSINKFNWPMNPDGSRGDPIPSSEYREVYEDVPFLEYVPFLDAGYHKWRSIFTGRPIDGYRHNWRDNSWSR